MDARKMINAAAMGIIMAYILENPKILDDIQIKHKKKSVEKKNKKKGV